MSSLSTGTTSSTGFVATSDTSGDLVLKTGSSATTALTISGSTQAVTLAGSLVMGSATLAQPSGAAPQFTARAWVNFNGTGTPAIRASGNVSSITDNGVGDYTVNFTTAMPDANYALAGSAKYPDNAGTFGVMIVEPKRVTNPFSAGSIRIAVGAPSTVGIDSDFISVNIVR